MKNVTQDMRPYKPWSGGTMCIVVGCNRRRIGKGFCRIHYYRSNRYGSPFEYKKGALLQWCRDHVNHAGAECLIWPYSRDTYGYPNILSAQGKKVKAHRWMCEAVNGPPIDGSYMCCHSCGNGHLGCINPKHLRWGSAADNSADRIAHGKSNRGEKNPRTRFTTKQVLEIKRKLASGVRAIDIARELSVSRKTIGGIAEGRVWGWLDATEGSSDVHGAP